MKRHSLDYNQNRLPWLENDHPINMFIADHTVGIAISLFFGFLLFGLWIVLAAPTPQHTWQLWHTSSTIDAPVS